MVLRIRVEDTFQRLLAQEDTDRDRQITIKDAGPKAFTLETADGFTWPVRGTYSLSNLLQALALSRAAGESILELNASTLVEPPVRRITRLIRDRYWRGLTRRMDAAGMVLQLPRVTVIHNGIVIHNNLELPSVTPGGIAEDMVPKGPLMLQFHGDEPPAHCARFGRPYLKAIRMRPGVDAVAEAERYREASGVLLDAYQPGVRGGTGRTFDWDRVRFPQMDVRQRLTVSKGFGVSELPVPRGSELVGRTITDSGLR